MGRKLLALAMGIAVALSAASAKAQTVSQSWRVCLGKEGTIDENLAACDWLIGKVRSRSDLSDAYSNSGGYRKAKGLLDAAVEDFSQAIALDGSNVNARVNRASIYDAQRKFELARADYLEIVKFKPRVAEEFLSRGHAYDRLGNLKAALDDFDSAVKLRPSIPSTRSQSYRERGAMLQRLGSLGPALADLSQAVALNPQDPYALVHLGQTNQALNRFEPAVAAFKLATVLNPRLDDAWWGLCTTQAQWGAAPERAQEDCNAALARNPPRDKSPFIGRALAEYRLKRFDDAISDADKALEIDPKNAAALYLRGLAKLGGKRDGDADLQAAKAMNYRIEDIYSAMGIKR
jgi:tetratricopeptide (TPR) repeat protein